nr:Fringe [Doryteuthis pealeii]
MSSSSSPLYDCDYYRPCDLTSNAASDGYHYKRGAMRVTLRKAVQGSIFIACIFLLNFVYFNAYLIQWRQGFYGGLSSWQAQHRDLGVADLRIGPSGPDESANNIGAEYDAVVIPGRDLLRDLRGIAGIRAMRSRFDAEGPLRIWGIVGDSVAGSRRVANFWRSNQPVDSGDTRSLLDLQTRKKRRRANAKVLYEQHEEQVPLLAVVPGVTPKRQRGPLQQQVSFVNRMEIADNRNKIQTSNNRDRNNNKNLLIDRLNSASKLRQILKFRQESLRRPTVPVPSPLSSSLSSPSPSSSSSLSSSVSSSTPSSGNTAQTNGRPTTLNDIFISVKTTKKFHDKRLKLVLDTWFQFAKDQTYFFTDTNDNELDKRTNNHMINTNCSAVHNRQALCCKMAQEYDTFMESKKRWFCHVDDDTYVNVPKLVTLLQKYNHTKDWYLGKPSLKHPIEIMDRDSPRQKISFWFATGGAGFCISRSLALKMMPHAGSGRLMNVGEKIRLPDDCTVGYIIGHILKKQLTIEESFHSHLEALWLLRPFDLDRQVTFSYSKYGEKMNIVNVPGFTNKEDPTRLWSIHCHLFPYLRECRSLQ